jgi:penicillin-binding protein 2
MPTFIDASEADQRQRLLGVALFIVVVFTFFGARLLQLQVIKYEELSQDAKDNYTVDHVIVADRGTIFDRHSRVLASNRPTFDVYLTPRHIRESKLLAERLSAILQFDTLDRLELVDVIHSKQRRTRYKKRKLATDVSRAQVAKLEALAARQGGVSLEVSYQRVYSQGEVGAHFVGYLGNPTATEVKERSIYPNQMVGRYGIEQHYDHLLQGQHGVERFVVDAKGRRANGLWAKKASEEVAYFRPPVRGQDLVLSIDAHVQSILVRALEGYESGSVVLMDPRSGELLGSISKPSFDPNIWSGRLTSTVKRSIDENPYKPLIDKSVHSFFPGSVYKVVTALAAMEEGILDPELPIDSPGAYEYGNRVFHCYKLSGHGRVDLNGAMAASADVYFYKLGERLGIDTLAHYARHFGFGERLISMNGESRGIVPTKQYHDDHTAGGFQHGLSLSSAIGQGAVQTSPLQMAVGFSALANHGVVYQPQLLLNTQNVQGDSIESFRPKILRRLEANPYHITMIRRSLERAVNDPRRATGYRAAVPMGRVAGKTGTAQVKTIIRGHHKQKEQRWRDRDHAWFAGFAPFESPRLTAVVFLEHGGSGGKNAAPIARKVIETYHQEIEPIFDTQAQLNFASPLQKRSADWQNF